MSPTTETLRRLPQKMHPPSLPDPKTAPTHSTCESVRVRSMPESYAESSEDPTARYSANDITITLNNCFRFVGGFIGNVVDERDFYASPRVPQEESVKEASSKRRCRLDDENELSICNCNQEAEEYQSSHYGGRYNLLKGRSISDHANEKGDEYVRAQRTNTFWRNNACRAVFLLTIGLLCTNCNADQNGCAVGIQTPGRTWPPGDIVLEQGDTLKIYCMLNETYPGKNSSDLVFFHNKRQMEREFITVLNETTILMSVENPPPAEDMYYCKLNSNVGIEAEYVAVCLNKVIIGSKPLKPLDFNCVSYNWEVLNCTWIPAPNYIETNFSLQFKLPVRKQTRHPCPKPEVNHQIIPNSCVWNSMTSPIYRQPYEYYTFILNAENALGSENFTYKYHHYAHVIPSRPGNLSVLNKTYESALLHWTIPFPMQSFPPGLHHRVSHQNVWDSRKEWQNITITNDLKAREKYFNLTGLQYANTLYDIRVFLKSAVAVGDDKWSDFSTVTFKTAPKLPGLPPKMDIGSFEVVDNNANRDVYLYWQRIPQQFENGDNFTYHIAFAEENDSTVKLQPNETTKNYVKFKAVSNQSLRFELETRNSVGANKERTKIYVPSKKEIPPEPIAFTKIAFEGGLYELSWKAPAKPEITNYTIFWCQNDRDRPYQCNGYLDWVQVPMNTTVYNMTVPEPTKVYQFAIAANTRNASSGMVWASCTVIHNKGVGKMKTVWINSITSTSIEVGWKLDCSDRIGAVEGFNIYYCPIVSPHVQECKGPKMNTTIIGDTIRGTVDNLTPYTTYMLSISVLTKSGEGSPSDYLYNTTLEAAPETPPQGLTVTNVTNSTFVVSWNKPDAMNGVLRYYEVYYDSRPLRVEEETEVEIKNLTSHKNYSISVAACTVACSKLSPPIYALTEIGTPGKIDVRPNVLFQNSSEVVLIKWNAPKNPGGHLDYYQVRTAEKTIFNSTENEILVPVLGCNNADRAKQYLFQVRAVNIAADGTHLKGPWSDHGEGSCYGGLPVVVWIIIWIIGSLSGVAFLLFMAYTSNRMWLKCKAMRAIEIKLPPGLAPDMKLLGKVEEQHTRKLPSDSSGCSSGQGSATPSMKSDSHESTDSGADVDPAPMSPNKLLDSPPSLRQRNVGNTKSGMATDSALWDPCVKVAKSSEVTSTDTISMARSTPNLTDSAVYPASQQTWSSTGYSSEELSSNASPVPKETANVGGYSVVGVAPIPLRSKSKENTGPTGSLIANLIPSKADAKPTNPYISLASLDKKAKETVSSIQDLNDLMFAEPISKSNLEDLAPFSISESVSKPYVQTAFIDSIKKPFSSGILMNPMKSVMGKPSYVSTTSTDSGCKPVVSTFPSPTTSLKSASTKPYIPVTSASDGTKTPYVSSSIMETTHKPYVPVSSSSDAATKPYVPTTSVFQMLQQHGDKSESPVPDVDDSEIENLSMSPHPFWWQQSNLEDNPKPEPEKLIPSTVTTTLPIVKQSSGYVTITENPAMSGQQTAPQVSSPYVQHQRFDKQPPQQSTGATDEQYSKVTVVPTTIQ